MSDAAAPATPALTFSDIASAIEGSRAGETGTLALTASVVVVGPQDRLPEAAAALESLGEVGVRSILISYGENDVPPVRIAGRTVTLEGLRDRYLDNAVAALRLSSLPTLIWWRGGPTRTVDGLSELADRLVLDAEDPAEVWRRVPALAEHTYVSDLRWTRLTRWRGLMSHFFDIPDVRDASRGFDRLTIAGSDRHCARLFAGWLVSSLKWDRPPAVNLDIRDGAPIARVELGDGQQSVTLDLAPRGGCVETVAHLTSSHASRIVSLGDQGLARLLGEELRIRSRDAAFERAVAAAEGIV